MTPSSRAPLRTALVGYGLGGAVFHAPLLAANPDFSLEVVVTGSAERRAQASREHPGVRLAARLEELWEGASAGAFDLVVISTPNRTHAPLAAAALARGAHVVVDKPLAVSVAEGRSLSAAALAAGRLVIPFQNRRWDGDFLTVRSLLAGGSLGTVHRFESRFERWRPEPKGGWKERADPAEAGGLLYDIGSHLIDQALVLFGPARAVYAELDRRRAGVAVDDDTYVALTHRSGVRSHLYATVLAAQTAPRFRLLGTSAAYTKMGLDVQEAALRAGRRPDGAGWGEEPPGAWGALGNDGEAQRIPTRHGDYPAFYAGVARALRGEGEAPVTTGEAIATLEVIEAAKASAAEGRVVTLGDGASG